MTGDKFCAQTDPELPKRREGEGWIAKGHVENWFDCIRARERPNADVEIGHRTVTVCQLLVIAKPVLPFSDEFV